MHEDPDRLCGETVLSESYIALLEEAESHTDEDSFALLLQAASVEALVRAGEDDEEYRAWGYALMAGSHLHQLPKRTTRPRVVELLRELAQLLEDNIRED